MNRCTITGNLGKEPEQRQAGESAVCNFSVGVRGFKADQTDWFNVVTWNKTAENCKRYLNKGSKVLVDGRIETRKWTDKEGNDRYTTELIANNVEFLDPPRQQQEGTPF